MDKKETSFAKCRGDHEGDKPRSPKPNFPATYEDVISTIYIYISQPCISFNSHLTICPTLISQLLGTPLYMSPSTTLHGLNAWKWWVAKTWVSSIFNLFNLAYTVKFQTKFVFKILFELKWFHLFLGWYFSKSHFRYLNIYESQLCKLIFNQN